MSIKHGLVLLAALAVVQPVFADDDATTQAACAPIVKSCSDAGYTHEGSQGKQFWQNCMKPLVMGQSVQGITVDAKDVKACRSAKITSMQKELSDMKAMQ